MKLEKAYFGYSIFNGIPFPVIFYQLPTDGNGKFQINGVEQLREVDPSLVTMELDALALVYPYNKPEGISK